MTSWIILHDYQYLNILEFQSNIIQTDIYLSKFSNGKNRTMCKICSKLRIKTPKQRSDIFIVSLKHIPHIFLIFALLILNQWIQCWLGLCLKPWAKISSTLSSLLLLPLRVTVLFGRWIKTSSPALASGG